MIEVATAAIKKSVITNQKQDILQVHQEVKSQRFGQPLHDRGVEVFTMARQRRLIKKAVVINPPPSRWLANSAVKKAVITDPYP